MSSLGLSCFDSSVTQIIAELILYVAFKRKLIEDTQLRMKN